LILLDDEGASRPWSFYFRNLDISSALNDLTAFSLSLRRNILNQSGSAIGRLYIEANNGEDAGGRPIIGLNLTARGAPSSESRNDALLFLAHARRLIVETFDLLTSSAAHAVWGKMS
jgi:hypothetical protein